MNVAYVLVGGCLGTLSRYYVTGAITSTRGLGVFVVNMSGTFLIALFLTLSQERFLWPPQLRLLVATGFLGAYTTFSTWQWEAFQMMEIRDVAGVALNLGGSLFGGILAIYGGTVLGRSI